MLVGLNGVCGSKLTTAGGLNEDEVKNKLCVRERERRVSSICGLVEVRGGMRDSLDP